MPDTGQKGSGHDDARVPAVILGRSSPWPVFEGILEAPGQTGGPLGPTAGLRTCCPNRT